MGATESLHSLHRDVMRDELEMLETALVETQQRPIDFDNEASAGAHLALNTLRNAYYHCQSSRRRGGLRRATVEKFVCTGARPSVSVVRFDADVMDIDTRQLVSTVDLPKKRVPADLRTPAPPTALLFAHKLGRTKKHGDENRGSALRIVIGKKK